MRAAGEKGITLVELLLALAILGILAGAGTGLLSASVQVQGEEGARAALYQQGLQAMENITSAIRISTCVLVPNSHAPVRTILAFSGTVNDDGDFYFGDPLFPRIDEDMQQDMGFDGKPGISGMDDDGDGLVDEGLVNDDDEDGVADEDPLDGIDNDGDGLIDEDVDLDTNSDGKPGIAGTDDDGDGAVDEGAFADDDEDQAQNEDPLNPVIYSVPGGTSSLQVSTGGQTSVAADHVSFFQATWEAPERILVELTLTGGDGKSLSFSEYVCPRNARQKTGKRVR